MFPTTTIGFENISFSDYEEVEDKAVMPPFLRSQATGGKSLLFTTPPSAGSGLMGGRAWGFIQCLFDFDREIG
jgi:hypothetical protein